MSTEEMNRKIAEESGLFSVMLSALRLCENNVQHSTQWCKRNEFNADCPRCMTECALNRYDEEILKTVAPKL